jgi:hypothetical protein
MRDALEAGFAKLPKIERLIRAKRCGPATQARLPKDDGDSSALAISPNVLDRQFSRPAQPQMNKVAFAISTRSNPSALGLRDWQNAEAVHGCR